MIESMESRRLMSATALLTGTELNVAVTSTVNTTINVTYADGKISVYVQDEAALRRVYLGARKAINTINHYIDEALPQKGAATVHDGVKSVVEEILAGDETKKLGLLVMGLLLTVWGASGGMSMTMVALDTGARPSARSSNERASAWDSGSIACTTS